MTTVSNHHPKDLDKEGDQDSHWQHQPDTNLDKLRFIVTIQENNLVSFYGIGRKRSNRVGSGKVKQM